MGEKNLPRAEKFKYKWRTWVVIHSATVETGSLVSKCVYCMYFKQCGVGGVS